MRLGVRGRIFLASLGLIAAFGAPTALYFEHELRRWLEEKVQQDLLHTARVAAEVARPGDNLVTLADRIGSSAECRITIINSRGQVVGDSRVGAARLASLDNHGQRPEVLDALAHGTGLSKRPSATLDTDMLYVAVPATLDGAQGVIRASLPLSDVYAVVVRLRFMLGAAALLGLFMALAMTYWASALVSKPVKLLVDRSRPLLHDEGDAAGPPDPSSMADLAPGSVANMARELDRTLGALARERDRFQTVLQSMSEAVIALDQQLQVKLLNQAATELLKISTDAIAQPLANSLAVPELLELAKHGQTGPASLELNYGDRLILARATPLTATGGSVIVMHDVTNRRRLETVRKDFVANVSHELRTPVSIIRANAETLLDGGLEDPHRSRSFVDAIHRHAERLSNLIADLLDLSRIEAGRYKLNFRSLDCRTAALRGVDAVEAKAQSRGIEIATDCPTSLMVKADPKALDQILMNLLDNAVKYSSEGGKVMVRVRDDDLGVRFDVLDEGRGIAPEQRTRIFERFYRVDPGRSRDMGGTGLGLAIVKHLAESMGGQVGVEAVQPSGSAFWFTLPKVTADARATSGTAKAG